MIDRAQKSIDDRATDERATDASSAHDTKNVKPSASRWRMVPLFVMTLALGTATVMLWLIQQTPEPSPVPWHESHVNTFSAQPSDNGGAGEMLWHEPAGDDEIPGNDAAISPPIAAPQRTPAPSPGVGPGASQTMQTIVQQSLSPAGREMSEQEPAGLRPIESSQRISGFVRTQGGVTEIFSVWEVTNVSVEQAIAHYDTQARSTGFVAIKNPTAGSDAARNDEPPIRRLVTYTRSSRASQGASETKQTLLIRVQRYDELTRVTLWLRQPATELTSQPSVQSQPGAIR